MELQATHGNITDKEAYKKALYAREAEGSTYVDNGITVPHAKTNVVHPAQSGGAAVEQPGAAVAGALSMTFGCALRAPRGGIFVFPVVNHAVLYCVALAVGSVLGSVILSLLKKNRTDAE